MSTLARSVFCRPLALLALMLALVGMSSMAVSAEVMCDDTAVPPATALAAASPEAALDAVFPEEGGTLTVFAAASLTDAFADMEQRLEEAHPGLDIVIETAGSQTLVTQLQQGAEADVLATANIKWMDTAKEDGLIKGDATTFTGNRLVIVAPTNNPAGISSIEDLAGDDITLILAGSDVPAGTYAQRALCVYAMTESTPDGFIEDVNANLASEEQDVRNVLAKIQLGEADAGVIYASDAFAAALSGAELTVIEFPDTIPTNATYPIAPVAGGNTDLANAFIAYVLSDEGQQILSDYGFSSLP